jgi:hypothetical protein
MVFFAYLFDRPGRPNKWSMTALLGEGKVQAITVSEASVNERMGFQPFRLDLVPNQ